MHVFLYIPKQIFSGRKLRQLVEEKVEQIKLMSFVNLSKMGSQLKLSVKSGDIVIFLAATDCEIDRLLDMQEFLEDVRLILILPDSSAETVAKGHLLRPRFLTCANHDMAEISSVLEKMIQKS